jgi:rhodanese-related sulfurtransferase
MWKADPESIRILDVRTPEEYWFVGHAPMARNIPLSFVTRQWDADKRAYVMQPNADFVAQVKEHYQPTDTLLIVCRSGDRSKKALDLLAKEGFQNAYNVRDGMEGETVRDPESVFQGKRMKNGWKNAGLPWTCELDPELVYRGGGADQP